jgi:predicted peptidase
MKRALNTGFTLLFLVLVGCSTEIIKEKIGKQSVEHLEEFITQKIEVNYLLYIPEDYKDYSKKWPLMLFLHGAGERGADIEKVKVHGPPKLIEQGKSFPFIVVSPQCPENQYWSIDALNVLLENIINTYSIDEERIYLTGLSMGGYGTWAFASAYPEKFAALAPICGGGNPDNAYKLKNIPIWVFHGAKDKVVKLEESQKMVDAIEDAGGNIRFTIYPESGHDSWTDTYNNEELYLWFQNHKVTN